MDDTPSLSIDVRVGWKPTITSNPTLTGAVNAPWSYTIATNETSTYAAPTKPAWATLTGSTISGTPTEGGTYAFQITATSTAGTLTQSQYFNVTISAAAPVFTTMPSLVKIWGETPYSYEPATAEASTIYVNTEVTPASLNPYSTDPLKMFWIVDGERNDALGGNLLGWFAPEPGALESPGFYSCSIYAVANGLTTWQNWTVEVIDDYPPTIHGTPQINATLGVSYISGTWVTPDNATIIATAPDWLNHNGYGGLSGTPMEIGQFSISIHAVKFNGKDEWLNYTLAVTAPNPIFLNEPLENATKRVWYSWTAAVDMAVIFSVSAPGWLDIHPLTGQISGLPIESGTFTVDITATSMEYETEATLHYVLTVADVLTEPSEPEDYPPVQSGTAPPAAVLLGFTEMQLMALALMVLFVLVVVALARRH